MCLYMYISSYVIMVVHVCVCVCALILTVTCIDTHTHMHTWVHTHTHVHACMHKHINRHNMHTHSQTVNAARVTTLHFVKCFHLSRSVNQQMTVVFLFSCRSPSLIIVDNIDILCPNREVSKSDLEKRTVSTFLTLMDGVLNVSVYN